MPTVPTPHEISALLAEWRAEDERLEKIAALVPDLLAVIEEARSLVAKHMAVVSRNVGPEPMYPKTLQRMDEAVALAKELMG